MHGYVENSPRTGQKGSLRAFFATQYHVRLLRHAFLMAVALVSCGLITSGALELVFRHRGRAS